MKAFAENKINATQNLKFVLEGIENIVGKGENAGFSISQYIFQKPKSGLSGKGLTLSQTTKVQTGPNESVCR